MATVAVKRSELVRALPTFSEAAELIDLDPSGITRAVDRLGIAPEMWGRREKHLRVADVLRIATVAQRASVEEVAGALLDRTEQHHPILVPQVRSEIDRFLAELPEPVAGSDDTVISDLRAELPKRWAQRAEGIYRRHAGSSK
jgi:hypothetical protein